MRIAFLSTILGYPWGSPDRLWTDLAFRCQQRGDALFLGISPLTADRDSVRYLVQQGATLHLRHGHSAFLGRRQQWKNLLPWRRRQNLEVQLAAFAPEVVVLTQGASYDILAEDLLVRWLDRRAVPVVVLCHNNQEGIVLAPAEIEILKNFFDRAAHTFFVSSHNRRCAERHLGSLLPRAGLVQNPLALHAATALPWPADTGIARLGLVGRLDLHHKGIDLLLEALGPLQDRFNFSLSLTGRAEDPVALEAAIRRHHLQDRVQIHPPVGGEALLAAYAALELFVLPSRYEGCSSAMIEALMCGRPVLAAPVGGVDDWIEEGRNGFVTAASSVEAVRHTLEQALAQRHLWENLGRGARHTFETRRDPDPVASLQRHVDLARTYHPPSSR